MQWIAPSEKDTATDALEKRLWDAADQLRANSGLTSAQYSTPVLGLISRGSPVQSWSPPPIISTTYRHQFCIGG
ncbi:protein of unknown function [Nitrospira defluvii]|jgi:hypothetical protein|uniref:Uncharacterized protein n=1 Tax=Nitrospira defluvii TaxID=330214 RepID=D8PF57_9BACT|nr:protein of unknown function [Nitrospira defluvii]